MKMNKGFTLIELLVVVAIIGILASVVLASLNTARGKGSDAAIQANLTDMQTQAAVYYDGNGNQSYGTNVSCVLTNGVITNGCSAGVFSSTDSTSIFNGLKTASIDGGGAIANVYGATSSDGSAYAVEANLKGAAGYNWCVDSGGKSEKVSGAANSLTTCP
jgi:prepilin-type N-terminal cleavage/methylation domain-containing protein